MQPSEQDLAYLWDMLAAAKDVSEIMAGKGKAEWNAEKVTRRAIERSIEIVGKAARRVSKSCQDSHPEIPWHEIVGQRNILAHEYGQIDYDLLFDTATRDIPELIKHLEELLPPTE